MRLRLGLVALLGLLTPLSAAQVAPDGEPFAGPLEYTVNVFLGEKGATLAIYPSEILVPPNSRVTFHVENAGGAPHDFTLVGTGFEAADGDTRPQEAGAGEAVKTPLLEPAESYDLVSYFPSAFAGSVTYICSVPGHRAGGMEGRLSVGAGAPEAKIEDYGVNYYAYWIGVISFVIIFAMLFATFFLFRYGETKNVLDHRTGTGKALTAAAGASTPAAPAHVAPAGADHRVLPDPRRFAKAVIVIAIVLFILWQYTPLFGGE